MPAKTCRLCAKADELGTTVDNDDDVAKILPPRMQTYLGLENIRKMTKSVHICRECVSVLKDFQNYYDKIQTAQIVWSQLSFEMVNKEKNLIPKPKRREAKLVPFIVRGLESGRFRGLEWENRARGLFRLPWPRQGTNRWRPEDSQLFKEWAVLKGRYSDKEDFVLWKTCIRTSLHKLPNIREVREYHNFMANPPYKVYCITDFAERYNSIARQVGLDHNYTLDTYGTSYRREQRDNDSDQMNDNDIDDLMNSGDVIEESASTVTTLPLDNSEWCVACEETVGESDDWNPKERVRHSLKELPSDSTVAKWIQDFKTKFCQQQQALKAEERQAEDAENDDRKVVTKEEDDSMDSPSTHKINARTANSSQVSTSSEEGKTNSSTRQRYDRNCKGKNCPECGLACDSVSALVKHRQQCPNLKKMCSKNATRRSSSLDLVCSICDKKFATSTSLKNHFNTHFGIRPYTCNSCMDGFYTVAELDKHKAFHAKNANSLRSQ